MRFLFVDRKTRHTYHEDTYHVLDNRNRPIRDAHGNNVKRTRNVPLRLGKTLRDK